MNCDALSLSGERTVIANRILLLLQTLNESTQEYDTTLEDIYSLFILASSLLQSLDSSSTAPISSTAVATWVSLQLAAYRRTDGDIEMPEVNGLLTYLNNYRLLTNNVFTSIQTQTLQYDESGPTDLKTRIQGLDARLTADEGEMHDIAQAIAGMNFTQDESTLSTFVATHMRDYLTDTAFKQSKFHEIFVTSNEWSATWGTPNYIVKTQDNTHTTGYSTDWFWAMGAGADITMRYVYKRKHWDPTGLPWVPFVDPWPAGDHFELF